MPSLSLYICVCVCMHVLYVCMHVHINGGKSGAMGLQPHLILRMLYRILIFYHGNISFSKLAPPGLAIFLHHCMCVHVRTYVHMACKCALCIHVFTYVCMHKVLKTHIHVHNCSWDHIRTYGITGNFANLALGGEECGVNKFPDTWASFCYL